MSSKTFISQLANIHDFLHEIEGLKKLLRHSWLSDGRQESVAEHTWRMAIMAMVLYRELDFDVEIGKVLKMILVHDLAEVYAGDFHAFKEVPLDKHEKELLALQTLTKKLPDSASVELVELWQEFEQRETMEAKFAVALDKLEVLIQHNEADIKTWDEKEYDFNYYYAYDKVEFSEILTIFRDLVLEETIEKVEKEV
jgi:putative hydrolase of HD superfamily